MRQIRRIYFREKRRGLRHWLNKAGKAYGLAILTVFVASIFDQQRQQNIAFRKKMKKGEKKS